jgi:hypothetical protein
VRFLEKLEETNLKAVNRAITVDEVGYKVAGIAGKNKNHWKLGRAFIANPDLTSEN